MEWIEILQGMLGAVLGILLYRWGWRCGRRARLPASTKKRPVEGLPPLSATELQNFWRYDGGEMPPAEEE